MSNLYSCAALGPNIASPAIEPERRLDHSVFAEALLLLVVAVAVGVVAVMCRDLVRKWTLIFGTIGLLGFLLWSKACFDQEIERKLIFSSYAVPPSEPPVPGQEAIDLAITLYGIHVPANVKHPSFDPEIIDRGVTQARPFSPISDVRIGPAAFESWSLLGSTLAHEIEVHCKQHFFLIFLSDLLGIHGTNHAEREAYSHELANQKRFGLTESDYISIADTMDYFYPREKAGGGKIGQMIARLFGKEPRQHK